MLIDSEKITLSFKNVEGFTDEEFYYFCMDNPEWKFERNAQGQISLMPNTGGKTGLINAELNFQVKSWNKSKKIGVVFDSSTAFRLPDTSVKSPDVAWIAKDRWEKLTEKEQIQFPPLCPDFLIELMSETDRLDDCQTKMQAWMDNGCKLAWLIDPKNRKTWIYRPQQAAEVIEGFTQMLSGEGILEGFELNLSEIIS